MENNISQMNTDDAFSVLKVGYNCGKPLPVLCCQEPRARRIGFLFSTIFPSLSTVKDRIFLINMSQITSFLHLDDPQNLSIDTDHSHLVFFCYELRLRYPQHHSTTPTQLYHFYVISITKFWSDFKDFNALLKCLSFHFLSIL